MTDNPLILVLGFFCIGPLLIFAAGFGAGRASKTWAVVRRDIDSGSGLATGYSAGRSPAAAARNSRVLSGRQTSQTPTQTTTKE